MYKLAKYFALLIASSLVGTNNTTMEKTPATILIHGTLFPLISYYYHGVSSTPGISLAKNASPSNTLARFSSLLAQASPAMFPLSSFYLWGWSGGLSTTTRLKTAKELFAWLNSQDHSSYTIIGHSHGATIALLLAQIAQKVKASFTVERLILISCPVQKSTAASVSSPLFKKVYHLYSETDFAQICDPQGFKYGIIPIFSERTFKPSPHLIQAQIQLNGHHPKHNDFLLKAEFITKLPTILRLLDKTQIEKPSLNHFIIDIQNKKLTIIPKFRAINKTPL